MSNNSRSELRKLQLRTPLRGELLAPLNRSLKRLVLWIQPIHGRHRLTTTTTSMGFSQRVVRSSPVLSAAITARDLERVVYRDRTSWKFTAACRPHVDLIVSLPGSKIFLCTRSG